MEERRPNLVEALNRINDFYMELKWDFHSWGKALIRSILDMILRIDSVTSQREFTHLLQLCCVWLW